jgi:hypothetical protein
VKRRNRRNGGEAFYTSTGVFCYYTTWIHKYVREIQSRSRSELNSIRENIKFELINRDKEDDMEGNFNVKGPFYNMNYTQLLGSTGHDWTGRALKITKSSTGLKHQVNIIKLFRGYC